MRTTSLLAGLVVVACGASKEPAATVGGGAQVGGGGDAGGSAGGDVGVDAGGAGDAGQGLGGATGGEGASEGAGGEGEGEGVGGGAGAGAGAGSGDGGRVPWDGTWIIDSVHWRGSVCPADPSAVQRDVGVTLLRAGAGPGGWRAAVGEGDTVGDCEVTAAPGEGCNLGPEDFGVVADRIVDPGGFCAETQGCVYPLEKDLPVDGMGLGAGLTDSQRLAFVFDGSGRIDGVGEDGLLDPRRAADGGDERIRAGERLFDQLAPGDRAAVWVASGDGPEAVRQVASLEDTVADQRAALDELRVAQATSFAPLYAAVDAAVAAGATGVVLFTAGPPTDSPRGEPPVPVAVVHLDNPAMRSGASGTLWDLAALGCATGGSYIRVEDPADLQWALGDAHFRLGPSVSLGVDFAVALGDLGPPSGADVVLMLDLHVDLAGTLLTLADIPVPLRIP